MIEDALDLLPGLLTILVVVVAMPLNWYVTYLLWRLSRQDRQGSAIRVVTVLSASVSLLVTVFAAIFVNNSLQPPPLNSWQTMVITRGALLVLSVVPTVYWLRWYHRQEPPP